ncbi:DUF1190 domain-containing protein [Pseudomonas cichorii]|uniref:DUF1190 domain-containing protein n=1 Tax=Pseudomonas cichorii TaxID=36746 RepID=UPI001C8A9FF9|nr:DUF1190 domain-containing protein [Pseudomonas cichorii]MBX8494831.1 DUF1190 domain-containing protein [Pseudomonas cichorii]MBX8514948.1 DUF1190 domain-containing protein [Pseudomonas cichorii]MBX8530140.1 DUF1190 domain-containing protein [Pseudomonas cichorii]MBX8570347.1 DUF1190 domain-containing protein [Pseudomonas cichorii]MBX8576325.1 DUF1190 domain-containing protein [Pseudomonas cichorii]
MRRSTTKLVLASTLPLAMSACSQADDIPEFTAQTNFNSVQACVDSKVPVDVCSDAYMQALSDHRSIAPTYDDKASCETDFVPDYCQVTSEGKYMPKMGGFELAFSGNVPKDTLARVHQEVAQANPGGSEGLLTGLLIGNLLSSGFGSNRYYSQPVYQARDDRGSFYMSSLPAQIDRGKTFGGSTQARTSPAKSYSRTTLGRSLESTPRSTVSSTISKSSVSSTISRGGFGSEATARSGWGSKSSTSASKSSSFSFGG